MHFVVSKVTECNDFSKMTRMNVYEGVH